LLDLAFLAAKFAVGFSGAVLGRFALVSAHEAQPFGLSNLKKLATVERQLIEPLQLYQIETQ
jgi:hypothetical protein